MQSCGPERSKATGARQKIDQLLSLLLGLALLGGCASTPMVPYSLETPAMVLVPAAYAGVKDKRARFREIFCTVLETRKDKLPDYRPCEEALSLVDDEPAAANLPVILGPSHRKLIAAFVPGFGFDCFENWLEPPNTVAAHLRYDDLWQLELAASLSRIGLVTIPPETIEKHRTGLTLSGAEMDMFKRVPELGANLIQNIPRLDNVAAIVRFQDKHFDGTGLPAERAGGSEIPLGARILKVVSDFSKLESTGLRSLAAVEKMRTNNGCYDPEILAAAEVCFSSVETDPKNASESEVSSQVRELMTGDIFLVDVISTDGMVIASAGTVVTQMVMEKLFNFAQLTGVNEPILIKREQNFARAVAV